MKNNIPWRGLSMVLAAAGVLAGGHLLMATTSDYDLAQAPLFISSGEPPLMMMVMSRDEQLFNKAYSDYTNLQEGEPDNDGKIETTYDDSFDYAGYFGSNLCYSYQNNVSGFIASAPAKGEFGHKCAGNWSGNFLNWVTMSRLDLLRYVLYGGSRGADSDSQVILQSAPVPNDLHAWVKIYDGSDIGDFTPYNQSMSFCQAANNRNDPNVNIMSIATGVQTEWASGEKIQCAASTVGSALVEQLPVRVQVCAGDSNELREPFCKQYGNDMNSYYRPAGLLQEYGENKKLRFGLITGTFDQPRAGGVLRKNIGLFAGNGVSEQCVAGDEVDTSTGKFCANAKGIVHTIDSFKLTQWNSSYWSDCVPTGIANRPVKSGDTSYIKDPGAPGGYACSAWGNPLAEMYAEALRYISGGTGTSGYSLSSTQDNALSLSKEAWIDPYGAGGYNYCSTCSILVLSSGLPSYDANESSITISGKGGSNLLKLSAQVATNEVGGIEGINGSNVLIARDFTKNTILNGPNGTYTDTCGSIELSGLGNGLGICSEAPTAEGSYWLAGLSHQAAMQDLRPDLVSTQGKSNEYKNNITTYVVQMAETFPTFEVPVNGSSIVISPLCQVAIGKGTPCGLAGVNVGRVYGDKYTYGYDPVYDQKGSLVAASYKISWSDSLLGADNDMDGVVLMTFCVGGACKTNDESYDICLNSDSPICKAPILIGENEVMVRVEILLAYSGLTSKFGIDVSGANEVSPSFELERPGSKNYSVLVSGANYKGYGWTPPKVYKFTQGKTGATLLNNPLWYAAKYGNPKALDASGKPIDGKWDSYAAGTPNNYFLARNPALLKTRLGEIFESAAGSAAAVSGSFSGNVIDENVFSITASFNAGDNADWTGDVVAANVSTKKPLWSAATKLKQTTWSERKIFAVSAPTLIGDSGTVKTKVTAGAFTELSLSGLDDASRLKALGINSSDTVNSKWVSGHTATEMVNYLKGSAVSGFRERSSLLGDIVNSTPAVAQTTDDYGWGMAWLTSKNGTIQMLSSSYSTFLGSKASTTPAVYVGANDGMLHAFNGTATSSGGSELFAFIPSSSLMHMGELANPDYAHRYFVDGPQVLGDAYLGGTWKTVLVGSTGAGGSATTNAGTLPQGSIYALDVTNPKGFTEANVLWELSGRNDADLGQMTGAAVIVPMKIGSGVNFVAIFGNGVNSKNGNPVLYVVDIATGDLLKKLEPSSSSYKGKNGIINVAVAATRNADQLADTVYAGDIRGNLWKYDLSSSSPNAWTVAYSEAPLFSAKDASGKAQPITGKLTLKTSVTGDMMVYFGTGRYLVTGDTSDDSVQTFYAVMDGTTVVSDRSQLVAQTLSANKSSSGYEVRTVSNNMVDYSVKRGWYIDLVTTPGTPEGERFIGMPYIMSGSISFATYTPMSGDACDGGGVNWQYRLSAVSGGGEMGNLTDGNGNVICSENCGAISVNPGDLGANSLGSTNQITWVRDQTADGRCVISNVVNGVLTGLGSTIPCGRQSWRQLR